MAGKLVASTMQVNDSATATNNFVLKADNAGGVKLSRGNDGATTQDILTVDANGIVTVTNGVNGLISKSPTVAVGYGTGAGGSVTQPTNKATTVTLNTPTGQIITSAASLAAGARITFIVNNSLISSTDVVLSNILGGAGNYRIATSNIGSGGGSFGIEITNISAGSLAEALPINFAIIKGSTS